MTTRVPRLQALAFLLAVFVLAGCPQAPQMSVNPQALDFGDTGITRTFTILNIGGGSLDWTVQEVVRANADAPWQPQAIPWLQADLAAGSSTGEIDRVTLTVSRAGQAVGLYNNTGVRVMSNAGSEVIPVSMTVQPTLLVAPTLFTLSPNATEATFTIQNTGAQATSWQVLYLPDPDDVDTAQALPAGITAEPASASTAPAASITVTVNWPAGQEDFYLYVQSDAGSAVLTFRFGAVLQGLEILPSPLTLYVDSTAIDAETAEPQIASTLRIRNIGAVPRPWVIAVVNSSNPNAGAPIDVAPSSGTTNGGQQSEVEVAVSDARAITPGSGIYDLIVTSGDASLVVPIIIEILPIPEIEISDAPNPEDAFPSPEPIDTLDFGRDELQKQFWIVNVGSRGSQLYFKVSHPDQGIVQPLIVSAAPEQGDTTGNDRDFYITEFQDFVDGVPITVTVDRSNMTEDVETRTITVEAFDADFENALDIVESRTITIRVERPPLTFEGTLNRSRPPYVERFVFLLRDTVGDVIPTRTPEDLENLDFVVFEDEVQLDTNETNQFVRPPDDLRVNLVLMLDFTGSMYFAGTQDPTAPLDPGEAVELMKRSAALFLDDLPPSYRVALMYYNDRQQQTRLMHQFSTDRASLKSTLETFTLPAASYGVSTVRDALIDGMSVIAAEDPDETLPFDDADLRAIVYITDGVDNASAANENDVETLAEELRVRLYPVAYTPQGQAVNYADLLLQASKSGGHLYYVNDVTGLTSVLGSTAGLVLEPSTLSGTNVAYFNVTNISAANLTWNTQITFGGDWIASVDPSTSILVPGETAPVLVQLNPAGVPLDEVVEGEIKITSNDGEGTVVLRMTPVSDGQGGFIAQNVSVQLRDEAGTLWNDLRNQVVFTYITPKEVGFNYRLVARYFPPGGASIQGQFQRDGVFFPGDVLAGQIAMTTTGIVEDLRAATPDEAVRAEVYVRTDYVPRNVNKFRFRFFTSVPEDAPAGAAAALAQADMRVEIAPGGLLDVQDPFAPDWRLIPESDGIYLLLTEQANVLPYGAFGNLLKITFTGLDDLVAAYQGTLRPAEFLIEMRADNQIYVSPATRGKPSDSKYFLYPAGPVYPDRKLSVILNDGDVAAPARSISELADPGIDPEALNAWDRDEDALPDFNDPFPDDEGRPGNLVVPSPLEIGVDETGETLTIRNNRLDTFTWNIDPASIPAWISSITYGNPPSPTPASVLSPGESQQINLTVNRAGLPPGSSVVTELRFETKVFPAEEVTIRLFIPEQP